MPRNIRLSDYETEMKQILETDKTKEEEPKERAEKGTVADKIPHQEPVALAEGEKPTVDYYIDLIAEITEKVMADERIPKGQWGFSINMVFHAYTKDTRTALIAELKGGDNKE